jgi:hypothetical protein
VIERHRRVAEVLGKDLRADRQHFDVGVIKKIEGQVDKVACGLGVMAVDLGAADRPLVGAVELPARRSACAAAADRLARS